LHRFRLEVLHASPCAVNFRACFKMSIDEYIKIPSEDGSDPETNSSQGLVLSRRRWKFTGICTSLLATAFLVVVMFQDRQYHRTPTVAHFDCGTSVREAEAKGCHLDMMLYGWVPPQCHFDSLADSSFNTFFNREWFADQHFQQPLQAADLARGDISTLYTKLFPTLFHNEHCIYVWKKFTYAMEHGEGMVDNLTMKYNHTNHCIDSLANAKPLESGFNSIYLRFFECRRLFDR
jgi:hypothetical protein